MGLPWPARDYPHQQELCDTYLDVARWDVHAEHTPWDQVDERLRAFQETDEFRAWAPTDANAEFGDSVGRDVASKFRASWDMNP